MKINMDKGKKYVMIKRVNKPKAGKKRKNKPISKVYEELKPKELRGGTLYLPDPVIESKAGEFGADEDGFSFIIPKPKSHKYLGIEAGFGKEAWLSPYNNDDDLFILYLLFIGIAWNKHEREYAFLLGVPFVIIIAFLLIPKR